LTKGNSSTTRFNNKAEAFFEVPAFSFATSHATQGLRRHVNGHIRQRLFKASVKSTMSL